MHPIGMIKSVMQNDVSPAQLKSCLIHCVSSYYVTMNVWCVSAWWSGRQRGTITGYTSPPQLVSPHTVVELMDWIRNWIDWGSINTCGHGVVPN